MLHIHTERISPIPGREFSVYEFRCLEAAFPRLSCVEKKMEEGSRFGLIFPNKEAMALFQERFRGKLRRQPYYFTSASFLDFVLKYHNFNASFLQEPLYLALVAEIAQNLSGHPLSELFKERPEYFLTLLPFLSEKARAYFPPYVYPLKSKLESILKEQQDPSFSLQGEGIIEKMHNPAFDALAFWGFSASHWQHSLSILLGLYSGQQVLFFLQHCPGKAQEVLISTLEAYTRVECQYVDREEPSPMPELSPPSIRLAPSPLGVEEALLAKISNHLSGTSSQPLAIVFNSKDSLSGLGLSLRLDALNIPYFSSLKRPLRLSKELYLFKSWLAYQKELSVYTLLDWLNALLCDKDPLLLEKLRKALGSYLNLYATQSAPVLLKALGPLLEASPWLIPLLEPLEKQASIQNFREKLIILNAEASLGWERFLPHSEKALDFTLHASSFILYLEGMLKNELDALQEPRLPEASARIYLLSPELAVQVQGVEVIFANLNEALVPTPKHPLLNEATVSRINALYTIQGPGGEGQECLALPQAYLLSPFAQEAYTASALKELYSRPALRQIYISQEEGFSVSQALSHPYVYSLREALSCYEAAFQNLLEEEKPLANPRFCTSILSQAAKEALQAAHSSRRDPSLPFDSYNFCLYPEDARKLTFPAKAWEAFFQNPNQVWFQYILRVERWMSSTPVPSSALLIGTWVHDWLTLPSGTKSLYIDTTFLHKHILDKAQQALKHLKAIYQGGSMLLHSSLLDHWRKAKAIALDLAQALESSALPFLVSEWSLPESIRLPLSQEASLALRGRIDAIVSSTPVDLSQPQAYSQTPLWVLDFKTGKTPPLSLAKLQKEGTGLQVALYALALRSLGFQQVYCSVVRPKEPLEPQLCLADLEELAPVYTHIESLLQKGIFGARPLPYTAKESPYPIAFLPIADAVLQAKAALS